VKKHVEAIKPISTNKKEVSSVKPPVQKPVLEKPVIEKLKPVPQNLGLPDGSEYQKTGQRRPLIVFPK
jgi:hypothetical protein